MSVKVSQPRYGFVCWVDVFKSFRLQAWSLLILIYSLIFSNYQSFFRNVDKAASINFYWVLLNGSAANPVSLLTILKLIYLPAVVHRSLNVHQIFEILYSSEVRNKLYSVVDVSGISLEDLRDRQIGNESWLALFTTVIERVLRFSNRLLWLIWFIWVLALAYRSTISLTL